MKSGLVLEGGGMRGLFTAGVTDVLQEEGIVFDTVVGVSAGAAFGCNYKSRQSGRALRYNILLRKDPRYMGLRSFIKTGDYIAAEFCYHVVPAEIDRFDIETFARTPSDFWVVCSDIDSGLPVYHQIREVDYTELEWMRASASLPMLSCPVVLGGHRMLDGGLTDSIPLEWMMGQGHDRNLVVLTQPLGYRKHPMKGMPLIRAYLHREPRLAQLLADRYKMYNAQLDYVADHERQGDALVIAPPARIDIGRIEQNPDKMRAAYQLGRDICNSRLEEIREYLDARLMAE